MVDKVQIETEDNKATLTVTSTIFPGTYYLCRQEEPTPTKKDITITLNIPELIFIDTDTTLTVKVTSDNENVTTGTITLIEDGTPINVYNLNNNGEAIINYQKTTIGEHTLKIIYNGTDEYIAKQSEEITVSIVEKDTKITILDLGSGYRPYNISAKVTTLNDVPVNEGFCIVKLSGITLKDGNGNVLKFYVNDSGVALIRIDSDLRVGKTYQLKIGYIGTFFNRSETEEIPIIING